MSADPAQSSSQFGAALFTWKNEGGACARLLLAEIAMPIDIPQSTSTDFEHLRVRVIALENLLISLLSQAPDRPRALGREMATFISPRPGFTPHTRTLAAAAEMVHLVERAQHFQDWVEGDLLS